MNGTHSRPAAGGELALLLLAATVAVVAGAIWLITAMYGGCSGLAGQFIQSCQATNAWHSGSGYVALAGVGLAVLVAAYRTIR